MAYEVRQYHGAYNIQRRNQSVRYIVVHYVGAGSSAPGNALANCRYFAGGNRNASAHFFIDDASIYEYADPSAYATWHCGDGHGRYGITNGNSVGIEVCNNGGPYTEAEIDRLAWLVQTLMARFGVPASCVVRHYDASRKLCPLYYAQNPSAWRELHARITGGAIQNGDDDMTPDQSRKLDFIYQHMNWDEKTHFSGLGNLVAQQPVEYDGYDGAKGTASLGERVGYIDQRTHAIEAELAEIKSMLATLQK